MKNRIGALRREYGMNQRELGIKIGVGQTTVSAWETGKNEPDNESMSKMAKLFHVSFGYLAGYEKETRTRGLPEDEYNAYINKILEDREKAQMEREYENSIAEERGITEEEIEEAAEAEERYEWEKTDKSIFYESYRINKLCEYLSEEQRQRLLKVAETMFPYAANGMYTEEKAYK